MADRCPFCDSSIRRGETTCRSCGAAILPTHDDDQTVDYIPSAAIESAAAEPASTGTLEEQVVDFLRQNRKIDAIKCHRQATGSSLIEAKEAVESIARKHNIVSGAGAGCVSVILFAVAALGWLVAG